MRIEGCDVRSDGTKGLEGVRRDIDINLLFRDVEAERNTRRERVQSMETEVESDLAVEDPYPSRTHVRCGTVASHNCKTPSPASDPAAREQSSKCFERPSHLQVLPRYKTGSISAREIGSCVYGCILTFSVFLARTAISLRDGNSQ